MKYTRERQHFREFSYYELPYERPKTKQELVVEMLEQRLKETKEPDKRKSLKQQIKKAKGGCRDVIERYGFNLHR
jgi:hypothetical protein